MPNDIIVENTKGRKKDLRKNIEKLKEIYIDKKGFNTLSAEVIGEIQESATTDFVLDNIEAVFNSSSDKRLKGNFKDLFMSNDFQVIDDEKNGERKIIITRDKDFPIEVNISKHERDLLKNGSLEEKIKMIQDLTITSVAKAQEYYEKKTNIEYVYTKDDKTLDETYKSTSMEIQDKFSVLMGEGENPLNAKQRNCNRIATKISTIELLRAFKDNDQARKQIFDTSCEMLSDIDYEEISEYRENGEIYRYTNEDMIISEHPELVEQYKILEYGFDTNGKRKDLVDIFTYADREKQRISNNANMLDYSNQIDEIVAKRAIEELQLSSNPELEIAKLVEKYGREGAVNRLREINGTINRLKDEQNKRENSEDKTIENYRKEIANIVDPNSTQSKEFIDFIKEKNYDRVYANISINIIENPEKQPDVPEVEPVIPDENDGELERLIGIIEDNQKFNQETINSLIEEGKEKDKQREELLKNIIEENKRSIDELNIKNEENIQRIKDDFENQLSKKDDEIDELNGKITEVMKNTEEEINRERESTREKIEELKREYEEKDSQRQEEIDEKIEEINNESNNRIEEIQEKYSKEMENLTNERNALKEEKERLEAEIEKNKEEIEEKDNVIESQKDIIYDQNKENEELFSNLDNANSIIEEKDNELNAKKEELNNAKLDLEQIKGEHQKTLEELDNAKNQVDLYRKRYEEKCKEEEELRQKYENASVEDREKIENKLDEMQSSLQLAKINYDNALEMVNSIEAKLSELEEKEDNYNNIQINNITIEESNTTINVGVIANMGAEIEPTNDDVYEAEYTVEDEKEGLPQPSYIELEEGTIITENPKENTQVDIDEWIEKKEEIDANKTSQPITKENQMNIEQWTEIKKEQDEKAKLEKKEPVTYTKEDNVTIDEVIKENGEKDKELYSKPLKETQMSIDDLQKEDIEDEVLNQNLFDMRSEEKYFNFFNNAQNSEKADNIFQKLANSGISNKEILKQYKDRIDYEIEKQEFSKLSQEEKNKYIENNPEFSKRRIDELLSSREDCEKARETRNNKKYGTLPKSKDLCKETQEQLKILEEGEKNHE